MNKIVIGTVITGVIVIGGAALALYSNARNSEPGNDTVYSTLAVDMMSPNQIELVNEIDGKEKYTGDDITEELAVVSQEKESVGDSYQNDNDIETDTGNGTSGGSSSGGSSGDNGGNTITDSGNNTQGGNTVTNTGGNTQGTEGDSSGTNSGNNTQGGNTVTNTGGDTQGTGGGSQNEETPEPDEEKEKVWVVDKPEEVNYYPIWGTEYHTVCNSCHEIIDGIASDHLALTSCSSYTTGVPFEVQIGTHEEIIPEEGHWEYR